MIELGFNRILWSKYYPNFTWNGPVLIGHHLRFKVHLAVQSDHVLLS